MNNIQSQNIRTLRNLKKLLAKNKEVFIFGIGVSDNNVPTFYNDRLSNKDLIHFLEESLKIAKTEGVSDKFIDNKS